MFDTYKMCKMMRFLKINQHVWESEAFRWNAQLLSNEEDVIELYIQEIRKVGERQGEPQIETFTLGKHYNKKYWENLPKGREWVGSHNRAVKLSDQQSIISSCEAEGYVIYTTLDNSKVSITQKGKKNLLPLKDLLKCG